MSQHVTFKTGLDALLTPTNCALILGASQKAEFKVR
jgi:hypothetical protein